MACANYNATLQCGSGQVIEVDDSFFGRKTIHYCQGLTSSSITSSQEECSWVDVVDLIAGMVFDILYTQLHISCRIILHYVVNVQKV